MRDRRVFYKKPDKLQQVRKRGTLDVWWQGGSVKCISRRKDISKMHQGFDKTKSVHCISQKKKNCNIIVQVSGKKWGLKPKNSQLWHEWQWKHRDTKEVKILKGLERARIDETKQNGEYQGYEYLYEHL